MKTIIAVVLAALVGLAGCKSATLSTAERVGAVQNCMAAGLAAGIPIAQALSDKGSTDAVKAQVAQDTLVKAGLLGACAKLGENFVTVLEENQKAKAAPITAPTPASK